MKNTLIILSAIVVFFLGVSFAQKLEKKEQFSREQKSTQKKSLVQEEVLAEKKIQKVLAKKQKEEKERVYRIIAVGDIMLDRGVEKVIKREQADYFFPFEKIAPYLQGADLVFANLEGSVSDKGRDMGNKYSFRFSPEIIPALQKAGVDVVSLANNHILDWGTEALCDSGKQLAEGGIRFVGAGCNEEEANRPVIIQLGDTRIAFLAYTEFHRWGRAKGEKPGLSNDSLRFVLDTVKELKREGKADLVFVSMHWGTEYLDRAPKRIVQLAHTLIDGGVDLIIGHHPHVDQEVERYKNGWILYSLGNFIFDQSWSENTMEGLLAEIFVQDRKIRDIVPHFVHLNKNYQPVLD